MVRAQGFLPVVVVQHHALGLSGSARGIEDVAEVIKRSSGGASFHHLIIGQSFAALHELIKIDGILVAWVFHHGRIINHYLLQRVAIALHRDDRIILELLTYKEDAYVGIVDDIAGLLWRTGSIEWNGHCPIGEASEVHEETLWFILRKNTYILKLFHAASYQGTGCLTHIVGELPPTDRHPLFFGIIPVSQGYLISKLFSLTMDQYR